MNRAVTVGVLASALLIGCTESSGPRPGPEGPSPATSEAASPSIAPTPAVSARSLPSEPPSRLQSALTVRVTTSEVAGVRTGTEARAAERALRARLGLPRTKSINSCTRERGRLLIWDTLTVELSDGADGGAITFHGWSVEHGPSRYAYVLPYDVALGTPTRRALRKIPGGTGQVGEGQFNGSYLLYTPRVRELRWLSDTPNDRGLIDFVSYRRATCD